MKHSTNLPVRFKIYLDCHHIKYTTLLARQVEIAKPRKGDFEVCTHDGLMHRIKAVRRQPDVTLEQETSK